MRLCPARTTRDNDVCRRRVGVKLFDQSGAAGEHRALVDRSFVGGLADVERWRLGEQNSATDARRAATAWVCERLKEARKGGNDASIGEHSRSRSIGGEIGSEPAAGFQIRKDQRGDVVAIGAGQNHVAHERRALGDERRAQRPDADPGAGRELEVLGQAPVEQKALRGVGRVGELQRVADLVEAFLVEGFRGERQARANSRG